MRTRKLGRGEAGSLREDLKMQHELDPLAERSVCRQIGQLLDFAREQNLEEVMRLIEWLVANAPNEERFQAAHLDAVNAVEALQRVTKKLA
jgi:ferritin